MKFELDWCLIKARGKFAEAYLPHSTLNLAVESLTTEYSKLSRGGTYSIFTNVSIEPTHWYFFARSVALSSSTG